MMPSLFCQARRSGKYRYPRSQDPYAVCLPSAVVLTLDTVPVDTGVYLCADLAGWQVS